MNFPYPRLSANITVNELTSYIYQLVQQLNTMGNGSDTSGFTTLNTDTWGSALPTKGLVKGRVYFMINSGVFIYDGNAWQKIA